MGFARGFSMSGAALLALALAAPAPAQFSDTYTFLKAVKDADAAKAMEFLNKPGQPTLNSRDGSTGDTALNIVIRRHDQPWINTLLARGAQTELRDRDGNTPLLIAVTLSDADAARALLMYGAKPDSTNARGETPLIIAVQHRDLPTVRLLVGQGANPRTPDTIAGKSARDYAAEDTRGAAILKLLDSANPKPAAGIAGPVRH